MFSSISGVLRRTLFLYSLSPAKDRSLLYSIFGTEDRRIPIFRFSTPKNGSTIGRKNRKGGLHSSSEERRTPSSTFSARRRKNSRIPVGRIYEERSLVLLLPTPRVLALLSSTEVSIFRPIFHLEDRSEDRDRVSILTLSLYIYICIYKYINK